jgi:hypothetical protein
MKYIKDILKKNMIGKCTKEGYIYNIDDKIYPELDNVKITTDNTSSLKIKVKFKAIVCYPIIKNTILATMNNIDVESMMITCINGPIICIIKNNLINSKNFIIENNKIKMKKSGEYLKEKDIVSIIVISILYYVNDDKILVMGYLDDIYKDIDDINNDILPKSNNINNNRRNKNKSNKYKNNNILYTNDELDEISNEKINK